MRLNKFIASATGMSRRKADAVIGQNRVLINGKQAEIGQDVTSDDRVTLDNKPMVAQQTTSTIMLNKPVGYVCSRDGQGSKTIYDLIPIELHQLKPVGRLDKNSSGLLLLSNDGKLAHELTHPSFQKTKIYKIALNKPLEPLHRQAIMGKGIMLDDGPSKLQLERISGTDNNNWKIIMQEGRNRQIRRTFDALGYSVVKLHRTHFGPYTLVPGLKLGGYERLGTK